MTMRLNNPVKNDRQEVRIHRFRLNILVFFIVLLSAALILRLGYLQISQFKRYETMSLKNQMNIIPIAPPRGIILDRNGVVLAENIPVYVLEIIPERVGNMDETLAGLRALLPSISDDDMENFKRARNQNRSYVPIPLKLKLTQDDVATFAINQYRFTGVSIKARLMRFYPMGEITAHFLGYVGRINVQELQHVDNANYRATNFIGKVGIEKYYEDILHGQVGYQQVETDVSGRTVRELNKQNPVSGEKLYLTIDSRLQKIAFEAMKGKRGAVVAMNTTSGDILAMISAPSYDPNVFVQGITLSEYKKLSGSQERPLYNRAVRGLYPPASTVKPFVGLAGLEKGVIDTNWKVYDPGWYKLQGMSHVYKDWKKRGHGFINLKRAITVSCDTYFYQLGYKLGISGIEDMLSQFGFGQLTHVDLYEEAPGILPSASWKKRTKGLSWYPGDTLITAIGQGFMLASPLQLANATATMGQKGKRYRPHLLHKSVQSERGETRKYNVLEEYPIRLKDKNNWDIIADAMHSVITSNEGTGYRFGRNTPYTVAAKTGTAQVFGGKHYENKRNQVIPEFLRDHSLFIGFAPYEKPEIAIAVMVENDHQASNVARKVMDAYFELKKSESSS
ncbi:penicillin-binding protein 2 [Legionella spiritensis]|uniref:Peptidoglycan D,D-transpeptidase MrdA n=2 Tax=Legionella spiritensis TaxID=452 RepID=A0A0W0Z4K9_LEGSP|nr:penicillin-binding protein 2 [Legionella spiritensis]SNV37445.1 penicillin-binding protein 2 [Legionella spiritensis]